MKCSADDEENFSFEKKYPDEPINYKQISIMVN